MNILTQLQKVLYHPHNKNQKVHTISKLLWWKYNQLFLLRPSISTLFQNTDIVCEPSSSYGSYVFYVRYPEYAEMKLIEELVGKNDTFFDVGANIGAISLLAASKAVKGRVYAFEPTQHMIPKIHTNVNLNNFASRITVVPKAVAHKNGTLSFSEKKESEVNHLDFADNSNTTKVTAITLDSFTKKENIAQIDFLKIDVEGAELHVLKGAKSLLKNKQISYILFEFNKNTNNFGYSKEELLEYVEKHNYRLFHIIDRNDQVQLKAIDTSFTHSKTTNLLACLDSTKYLGKVKKYTKY